MKKKKSKDKQRKSTKPKIEISVPSLDRRTIEKTMSEISKILSEREFASADEANAFLQSILNSGEPLASSARTPLEQAQDLMYEAWDSPRKRAVELAYRALDISKDCADAYVLLAEETARSLNEVLKLYEQGVKAGERALGPQAFKEDVGYFWGILETRPYMRARAGMAQCLWLLGRHQQAIDHYTDMLRLNPNDNQGVRYILVKCLLEEGSDKALGELLGQYEDDAGATWLYSRALWMFRQEGASKKANARLKEALEQNRFVLPYLLGSRKLPKHLPAYVGFGDENEAIDYVAGAIAIWQKTEGALEWLRRNLKNRSNT